MPGLAQCGRCGSVLDLNATAIDVHPPRASTTAKRVRRVVPRRAMYQASAAISDASQALAGRVTHEARIPWPEPDVAARLIVPGWAHIHVGLIIRGRFFLVGYLVLLALSLALWGTDPGSIFLGLAFSVHVSSVLDVLIRQGNVRFPAMMMTSGVAAVLLALLVYFPAGWVCSHLAHPIAFNHDATPFRRFDVVWVNRWAFQLNPPSPGDVVLFQPPIAQTAESNESMGGHTRLLVGENELIDRVIGRPGEHVVWNDGALSINGEKVSLRPLIPERLPKHLDITVPSRTYLILPTTSRAMGVGNNSFSWSSMSLISANDIVGGVYLRSRPVFRFWFIR